MNAHKLDAMIAIPNCDKIVPGMIMGALRVDVPTIFVSGGPMAKGYKKDGTPIDLATAFEAVGKRREADEQRDARRYYHDKQWTDAEIQRLTKRGQQPTVRNRIKRKIAFLSVSSLVISLEGIELIFLSHCFN